MSEFDSGKCGVCWEPMPYSEAHVCTRTPDTTNKVDLEARFLRYEDGKVFWQYPDGSHRGIGLMDVHLINKQLSQAPRSDTSDVELMERLLEHLNEENVVGQHNISINEINQWLKNRGE